MFFFLIFRRRSAILTQLFHHKKPSYDPVWVYETSVVEVIFCASHWELIYLNKWHSGTSEISTPPEIALGTHFHARHDTITCRWRIFLVATFKFGLLTIRWHSATIEHLFLCPQRSRSGLRKPKKGISINTNHSYYQRSYL